MNDSFGLSIYLGWWHELHELRTLAGMARDAGVRWLREPLAWALVEPEPGRWDFSRLDAGLDIAFEFGFDVMAQLGAAPEWGVEAGPQRRTMPKLDMWKDAVRRLVERYGDRITAWEIGNEPNLQVFWKPEPNSEEYAAFLAASHDAIRDVQPDATIVSMSVSGVDSGFIGRVLDRGGAAHTDVVAVHPYSDARGPEQGQQVEKVAELVHLLEKHSLPPRIWFTEIGWGTYEADQANGVNPQVQADLLVRGYALAMSSPGVERFFWFCLRDFVEPNPPDWPDDWEYTRYYGLVDVNLKPKPALATLKMLTEALDGLSFERRLETPEGSYAIVFSDSHRSVAICWSTGDPIQVPLPADGRTVTVTSTSGRRAECPASQTHLTVGPSPQFVQWHDTVHPQTQRERI